MDNKQDEFKVWLHKKYAAWLGEQPPDTRHSDFSTHLNISPSMLSEFLRGSRVPSRRTVYAMASVLGPEIYGALGLEKPKPDFDEVAKRWNELSDKTRLKIIELIRADNKR